MDIHKFLKKYKTTTTTDVQLLKYAKELGIQNVHYVMKDELLSLPRSTKNILINFHTSEQPGIHHCAIFNDKTYPAYFDSYGPPPYLK